MILWECSDRYDSKVMDAFLGDMYVTLDVKVNSTQFGFCMNRARKYGICMLKSKVVHHFSSLDNCIRLFHRNRDEYVGLLVYFWANFPGSIGFPPIFDAIV